MLYQIRDLVKTRQRDQSYRLLIKRLDAPKKAKLALIGPSGCGKSTTLDILGLSLAPDCAARFGFRPKDKREDIAALWQRSATDALADLRLGSIGFVLQSGELLPFLTTGENIILTALLCGARRAEAADVGRDLAERLGISHLWRQMPATLSVGERQRAAIARALASRPDVIIADEPTAALDPLHAEKAMAAFLDCVETFGSALILATHNEAWAKAGGLDIVRFEIVESGAGATSIIDFEKP